MSKKLAFLGAAAAVLSIAAIAGPVLWLEFAKSPLKEPGEPIESTTVNSNENNGTRKPSEHQELLKKADDVFPHWENNAFDKFTKYKNNEVILDEELVSYFIIQSIKRISTSRGTLEYSYKFSKNFKNLDIFLKWTDGKTIKRKNYTFFIDSL